jgi:hypothetical protein
VRLAVENERLQAEVRAQLDAVTASRARIVEAQDDERRRIERDLHDGAQQRLVSLQLSLQMLRRDLGPDADPAAVAELEAASAEAAAAIADIGSSPEASIRRSSRNPGSVLRSGRSPTAPRCRSWSPTNSTGDCPAASRRPPISWPPRR